MLVMVSAGDDDVLNKCSVIVKVFVVNLWLQLFCINETLGNAKP